MTVTSLMVLYLADNLSLGSGDDAESRQLHVSHTDSFITGHLRDTPPKFIRSDISLGCEMCANYEIKLQQLQVALSRLRNYIFANKALFIYYLRIANEI